MSRVPPTAALVWLALTAALPGAGAADLRHNPFQPPAYAIATPASQAAAAAEHAEAVLRLQSILSAGENSVVSVNGQLLSVGDKIDGYRLLSTSETSATFARKGKRLTLKIEEEQ